MPAARTTKGAVRASVTAGLGVAATFKRGAEVLLGRDSLDGAMLLRPSDLGTTLRMRFDIDVAFCDRDLGVIDMVTMRRNVTSRRTLDDLREWPGVSGGWWWCTRVVAPVVQQGWAAGHSWGVVSGQRRCER